MSAAASPQNPYPPPRATSHPASSTPLASRPSNSALASPSMRTANPFSPNAVPPILAPTAGHTYGPTSSPNYFGFQSTDSSLQANEDTLSAARQNWSPPSSVVRSAAAFSPALVPVDQNPDYAAFRRQSEGSSRAFSLGNLHGSYKLQPNAPTKLPSGLSNHFTSDGVQKSASFDARAMAPPPRPIPSTAELDPDSANTGRHQKRHLSTDSSMSASSPRKATPSQGSSSDAQGLQATQSGPDRHQRTTSANSQQFSGLSMTKHRAETVPLEPATKEESRLITSQHLVTLLESAAEDMLVLDLRVSTHYAASRISGALNLCIPTTLLKRPSFNVQKLAETFRQGDQRSKFDHWRNSRYIVVYDASASQLKDATVCLTTIFKFESEGYQGTMYILKGGFNEFSSRFPSYVDKGMESSSSTGDAMMNDTAKNLPPVIGGCPMPATQSAANPFFGNIRQNMDLIGGVGQIPLKMPEASNGFNIGALPIWLKTASEEKDRGARVAERFLQIEKSEQKRMQQALSGDVSYGTPSAESTRNIIAIAGLEKGSKNRYNNIWPFEHSRVKLQGIAKDGCDYVNANHISSPRTHKRYIATQGPIPATFADFWNVIWQQNVRVVVMLTAEKEGGQVKAHNYWNDQRYGPFKVAPLSEHRASLDPAKIYRHKRGLSRGSPSSVVDRAPFVVRQDSKEAASSDQPYVIVRRLTLSHEGFPFERIREVVQMQYSSWPDFGAPAHPAHLLGLVEQCDMIVRSMNGSRYGDTEPNNSRAVLVHCSAGCGRTGTFCTVDSVIDMLKRQKRARSRQPKRPTPMDIESHAATASGHESPFFAPPSVAGVLTSEPASYTPSSTVAATVPSSGVASTSQQQSAATDDSINAQDWIARDNLDLVADTVDHFRLQRLSMVQSLRQFVLCYETVLEWIAMQEQRDEAP